MAYQFQVLWLSLGSYVVRDRRQQQDRVGCSFRGIRQDLYRTIVARKDRRMVETGMRIEVYLAFLVYIRSEDDRDD